MNIPASSRNPSQGPGKGNGKGKGGNPSRSQSPSGKSTLKKLWCAEFAKGGSCKFGDKCVFPHLDDASIKAIKLGLDNTKAKAKAKPKAKASPAVAVADG